MTHEEFVNCYSKKQCIPRISPLRAIRLMLSPGVGRRIRSTFYFWGAIWIILAALSVGLLCIGQILNAMVVFIFVVFLPGGIVHYAANFIISKSLEDSAFFTLVTQRKVMQTSFELPDAGKPER